VWLVPGAADNASYTYKSLAQLNAKVRINEEESEHNVQE